MFESITQKFGEFDLLKLTDTDSGEYIAVIPEYGGCVNELVFIILGKKYSVINGCKTPEELLANKDYKSAKMLPFANRIPDGKYEFNGTDYQLPINWPKENHAIHGFLHDKKYDIVKKISDKHSAVLTLEHNYSGDYPGYPFPFFVTLTFQLSKNEFVYTTEVKNTSTSSIPMMAGWHPYFKLDDQNINDLFLKIPAKYRTEIDDRLIPNGKMKRLNIYTDFSKIGNKFLDICFPLKSKEAIVATELFNQEKRVTLQFWQETGFRKYNYLQIYTPPDRLSIAIEPMTSNTNSFNSGDGLIILESGEKFKAKCGVKLF